jgi:hypothetical protein
MADILERIPLYDGGCLKKLNHVFVRKTDERGIKYHKCRFCGKVTYKKGKLMPNPTPIKKKEK